VKSIFDKVGSFLVTEFVHQPMMTTNQKIELLKEQEIQAWCMGWDTMARALREQRLALESANAKAQS